MVSHAALFVPESAYATSFQRYASTSGVILDLAYDTRIHVRSTNPMEHTNKSRWCIHICATTTLYITLLHAE